MYYASIHMIRLNINANGHRLVIIINKQSIDTERDVIRGLSKTFADLWRFLPLKWVNMKKNIQIKLTWC